MWKKSERLICCKNKAMGNIYYYKKKMFYQKQLNDLSCVFPLKDSISIFIFLLKLDKENNVMIHPLYFT